MAEGLCRQGFDIDLATFEAREDALSEVLKSQGVQLIEHKCQPGTIKTGNVFIEYECSGKPSGLATTTAHMWALEVDVARWTLILTEELRDLCKLAYRQGRHTTGGDFNRTRGVLLPAKWLMPPYLQALKESSE